MLVHMIYMYIYDGPEGSCYSTDFFGYANKIFVTQKSFFCYAKTLFLQSVFFSAPISNFFVSFIILICNPISYLLLKLFCFNFSFLVFISFIFATQFFCFKCCFLFLFKALRVILLLIFFLFS